jgi:hypothetical protein
MSCTPLLVAFSTMVAPGGMGKLPAEPTLTVLPDPDEPEVLVDVEEEDGEVAGGLEEVAPAAGELEVAGGVLDEAAGVLGAELAEVRPPEHAARDRPAAQAAAASAAVRYTFMSYVLSKNGWVALQDKKLESRFASGIAVVSQVCDTGRRLETAC